jgi:uncharacterized protein YprB with RNaseH-like and TPR domain
MASNLKSRLQRIRNMAQAETQQATSLQEAAPLCSSETVNENLSGFSDEWIAVGYKVLKRSIISNINVDLPSTLPEELRILVPDFLNAPKRTINPEDFVFFDLETTGLSGGAGTLAFLAAIGFFVPSTKAQNYKLQIDQYLLLDYPGEPDFLETIIPILNDAEKIIVTYNGKTFDTKLFRTRCLMNGMKPPLYHEADLLHPARRLWKNILPNCSQAEIETSILGLDRTGDVSGAFAPQIWFDFLKDQNPSELIKICDHNKKDIEGLASIFSAIMEIAANPFGTLEKISFDIEAVTLRWRDAARYFSSNQLLKNQAEKLIAYCVEKKYHKAMYLYGLDLITSGFHDEGIFLFKEMLKMEIASSLTISVLNKLAIDAEWRLKDNVQALNYADALLQTNNLSASFRNKAEQRRARLLQKMIF